MKTPCIKYARCDESSVIVVPTGKGKKVVEAQLRAHDAQYKLEEIEEKIADTKVPAFKLTFSSSLRNFRFEITPANNTQSIFVFTELRERLTIVFQLDADIANGKIA